MSPGRLIPAAVKPGSESGHGLSVFGVLPAWPVCDGVYEYDQTQNCLVAACTSLRPSPSMVFISVRANNDKLC